MYITHDVKLSLGYIIKYVKNHETKRDLETIRLYYKFGYLFTSTFDISPNLYRQLTYKL